jgi:hypothetical protein
MIETMYPMPAQPTPVTNTEKAKIQNTQLAETSMNIILVTISVWLLARLENLPNEGTYCEYNVTCNKQLPTPMGIRQATILLLK